MSKVFITGASGFIAKHILRELFDKGYSVRASIRSDKRKAELNTLFPGANIEYVMLDLTKDDGWDEAMQGCNVLMHTASPFPMGEPKDPQTLIKPAVEGTLRAMKAAKNAGIKRVILTSSCAAIYKDSSKPKDAPSDESQWTSVNDPSVGAYEASKTLAEQAAWSFVKENPDMALTTINPGGVFGPSMDARYGSSLQIVEQFMDGKVPIAPPMNLPLVDVRDVAIMHVVAIGMDSTKGERFAAVSNTLRFVDIGRLLKEWDPSLKTPTREMPKWLVRILGRFVPDMKPIFANLGHNLEVSGAKAERVFDFKFIPAKEALIASAQSIRNFSGSNS